MDTNLQERSSAVLKASMKTVCAFLDSGGGTLIISVAGTGRPEGPEDDLKTSRTTVTPVSLVSGIRGGREQGKAAGHHRPRPASAPKTGLRTTQAPW